MPKVAVLLPVYNGGKHLQRAIQSILAQSYTDFELYITNDGSTDDTDAIVKTFSDKRITYAQQQNHGLTQTLNDAITNTRSEFIARMDSDDFSEPERLQRQVDYLYQHPEIGVLGTTAYIMSEAGEIVGVNPSLLNNPELQVQLLYQTPFSHGSIVFRRALLSHMTPPYYQASAGNAEDYQFWSRLATITKLANLPEPLYGWRDNPTGMSNSGSERQRGYALKISRENFSTPHFQNQLIHFTPDNHLYKNERLTCHGTPLWNCRRDNYTYLQFRIAKIYWQEGLRGKSIGTLSRAVINNPKYFARALLNTI